MLLKRRQIEIVRIHRIMWARLPTRDLTKLRTIRILTKIVEFEHNNNLKAAILLFLLPLLSKCNFLILASNYPQILKM